MPRTGVRRRSGWAAVVLLAGALAAVIVHVRRHVLPPGCDDPRTLVLVRQSLHRRFALPASVPIDSIRMIAGGPLAFRFVCQADLGHALLPSGAQAGFVRYTSVLAGSGTRHEVTVEMLPLLMWKPAP